MHDPIEYAKTLNNLIYDLTMSLVIFGYVFMAIFSFNQSRFPINPTFNSL